MEVLSRQDSNHVNTRCSSLCPRCQPQDPAIIILTTTVPFEIHQLPYISFTSVPWHPDTGSTPLQSDKETRYPEPHSLILGPDFISKDSDSSAAEARATLLDKPLWAGWCTLKRATDAACRSNVELCASKRAKLHLLILLIYIYIVHIYSSNAAVSGQPSPLSNSQRWRSSY